jgi:20S proteasome alpha/beta subunit
MATQLLSCPRHTVRRNVPPSTRVKYNNRMTIVAGFVNDNGVLLCADTLTTDGGVTAVYRSKIIPVFLGDGKAFFAFGGDVKFSELAIQRCERMLHRYNGAPRSVAEIAETIRKQWHSAFRESHTQDVYSGDQILCAIHAEANAETALYSSSNQFFARATNNVECIGCGESVARYLMGSRFQSCVTTQRNAFQYAINALGRVKEFMAGSVGGNLTAVNLNHDGSEHIYSQRDIERIERYAGQFDSAARDLLIYFMDHDAPGRFEDEFSRFAAEVNGIRWQWENALAGAAQIEFLPMEIMDAFRKAKPPDPLSTRGDPSHPQPSPE